MFLPVELEPLVEKCGCPNTIIIEIKKTKTKNIIRTLVWNITSFEVLCYRFEGMSLVVQSGDFIAYLFGYQAMDPP